MQFDWEAFTYEQDWLRATVQLEEKSGQDVQIGIQTSCPSTLEPTQLQIQLKRVKLLSVLFTELRYLLEQQNLGADIEAALVQGRQLVQARAGQLSLEQQEYFETLFIEKEANLVKKLLRPQGNHMLYSLLTELDWQKIAQFLSID